MEAQQQHQQQPNEDGGSGKGSFLCRQSSTRWTPTTDQIRILKELYYNNGVRSPSADQIQRISARLRQYGKIEGKNVFYWFQNHKARERQKKRLTTAEPVVPMQKPSVGNGGWKYPTPSNGVSPTTAPSTGMLVVGQMGSCGGYGSATMEKSFRDCSISAGGSTSINVGAAAHNFGWVGVDPYSSPYSTLVERRKQIDLENGEEEVEENQEVETPEIETLPLFPMHGEDINGFCNMKFPTTSDGFYTTWYRTSEESGSRTSLELSLSSYSGRFLNEPQRTTFGSD